tara:strand:+ start:491 stop:937 length:447 start_codon:yes stop_codon:yes gene_type:complete
MIRARPVVLLVATVVLLAGCGYYKAGTWEDDPKNWERAFNSSRPPDVVVVHSKYWCSPHWSHEFEYFFEIVPTPEFTEQLFIKNQLREIKGEEAETAKLNFFADKPAWFTPGQTTNYEVWVYKEEPDGNFRVFVNKHSGHLFLTDYQV